MTRARPASRLPGNRPIRPSWLRSRLAKWALLAYRLRLGFLVAHKVMVLTTHGRLTGRPRRTPLWYVREDDTLYCLSGWGASSDWLKNVRARSDVRLQVANEVWETRGRMVPDGEEVGMLLEMFYQKYGRRTVRLFYHMDRLVLVAFKLTDSNAGAERDGG